MDSAAAYAAHVYAAHSDANYARKLGSDAKARWYRAPIFWLAAALFAASIAGCVVTILLALGAPDGAIPDVGERLLSVPTEHAEKAP